MKTIKQIGFIAIAIITIALIGCGGNDNPPPKECTCNPKDHLQAGETCNCGDDNCNCTVVEQPKSQIATITGLLDGTYSATVKGFLTDTEWVGVAEKIKTALNEKYATANTSQQTNLFQPTYADNIVITVEKDPNPPYVSYSSTYGSPNFSINYAILNDSSVLQQALLSLARVHEGISTIPETDWTNSCNCTNETLHLVGETCCDGIGCNCEKNVVGVRANVTGKTTNGMAITNRESVANFSTMVTAVETALNNADLASVARQNYIKEHIKEIKIVTGNGIDAPSISGNILTTPNDSGAGSIRNCLRDWCIENGIEN